MRDVLIYKCMRQPVQILVGKLDKQHSLYQNLSCGIRFVGARYLRLVWEETLKYCACLNREKGSGCRAVKLSPDAFQDT